MESVLVFWSCIALWVFWPFGSRLFGFILAFLIHEAYWAVTVYREINSRQQSTPKLRGSGRDLYPRTITLKHAFAFTIVRVNFVLHFCSSLFHLAILYLRGNRTPT